MDAPISEPMRPGSGEEKKRDNASGKTQTLVTHGKENFKATKRSGSTETADVSAFTTQDFGQAEADDDAWTPDHSWRVAII
jgi:hypothetical protein